MRVLTVVGARPQFVKAAIVSNALRAKAIDEVLLHTGQHYDANMSDIFFSELEINSPDVCLNVSPASHGVQTAQMLEGIEACLLEIEPDQVLVYGDTNSTLAGALAASKLNIPVCHIEAGLRSFNREMPEEINRVLVDHLSDTLFTPTVTADKNLSREGIDGTKVRCVGDVMYDALLHFIDTATFHSVALNKWKLDSKGYVLATIHRAENTDNAAKLRAIVGALDSIAIDIPVVIPIHPRTKGALDQHGIASSVGKVQIIDPVGYLEMLALQKNAKAIVTDSGGVQKEAFFLNTPCVTVRNETEWPETLESGFNKLAPPTSADSVREVICESLSEPEPVTSEGNPFGNGTASAKIASYLSEK